MKLIGQRIYVRDLSYNDLEDFYQYGKDPKVGPSAGWKPFLSKDVAEKVLSGQIFSKQVYAIAQKDTNRLMGTISIYDNGIRKYNRVKTIGFSLGSKYWNHGYMTEAVKLMIEYIFTHTNCDVIEVGHHSDNYNSKRVIEKCGFTYDGRLCKYKVLYDGRLVDADFYSMTSEDYERMKKYE